VKIPLTSSKRSVHGVAEVLIRRSSGDPCEVLLKRSLHDLVQVFEILVRSSLRGPCMKILQMPCLRGACMKALVGGSWEVLVSRSCNICSSSSRPFLDDRVSFS